jgi:hypothetical protein
VILVAAALVTVACGGGNAKPAPSQDQVNLTGRVRLAGSTPLEAVMIQPEDSTMEVELVGELKEELERLSGAEVWVTGVRKEGGGLAVARYEILEIAGHVPLVGLVRVRGATVALVTDAGETLRMQDTPELLTLDGAKVWVLLDSKGAVTGYGVIRER